MGFFKSLFGGSNTPETEKEKNDKKNFEILKYDGIRPAHGQIAIRHQMF